MERAAIILNPAAGNTYLADRIEEIADLLRQSYGEVTVYRTHKAGDGADYVRQLASEVQLIIGAGGDGTIHELINALCPLEDRPLFAILPGGTCNDFSRAIGMNQDPLLAMEQIVQQRVKKVDVGKDESRYFLNFWGIGLITEVSNNIDSNTKDRFGKLSYYLSAMQTIKGYEPFRLRVECEDFEYDDDAALLIVGNGAYTGGMKTYFPSTDLQDGLFDVLIIRQTNFQLAWQAIQSKLLGQIPESEHVVHVRTNELTIHASPLQEIDCDGEIGSHTPARLINLRQHLAVIIGDESESFPSA